MPKLDIKNLRRRAALLALVPVMAAVPLFGAGAANAASGTGYDNTDPIATGCANDAVTIATRTYSNVDVDVRYSPTCSTNWIRVRTAATDVLTDKTISRDANDAYGVSAAGTRWDSDNGNSYSMQIYAPGSTCVHPTINIYWGEYNRVFVNDWTVC